MKMALKSYLKVEVLLAEKMSMAVFWVVTLCGIVYGYQIFENVSDTFLQNIKTTYNTTQHHSQEDHHQH
jgi:hypothetical protein